MLLYSSYLLFILFSWIIRYDLCHKNHSLLLSSVLFSVVYNLFGKREESEESDRYLSLCVALQIVGESRAGEQAYLTKA